MAGRGFGGVMGTVGLVGEVFGTKLAGDQQWLGRLWILGGDDLVMQLWLLPAVISADAAAVVFVAAVVMVAHVLLQISIGEAMYKFFSYFYFPSYFVQ